MLIVLCFLALLGHVFLWVGIQNRLHSLGFSHRIIRPLHDAFVACAALIPVGIVWFSWDDIAVRRILPWDTVGWSGAIAAYLVACWTVLVVTLARFVALRVFWRRPEIVRFHGRRRVAIDPYSSAVAHEERKHHVVARLPWNEALQLELSQWVIDVPRLDPALDGLSIVHLSDLHFLGRVGKAYFREVVRVSNQLHPDLVCITGDIIERVRCFGWIADTLGRLAARHGVFFVLGNHDARVDSARLRAALTRHGLIDLGSRWHRLEIGGRPVALAGDERPWFDAWGEQSGAPGRDALRIVLAHTPDRLAWARRQGADLMLAGHTHGGQIRLPPFGAICSPSRSGVKYVAGVFHAPPTILHVTRGISGDVPMRWNCRPEIALLRLTYARPVSSSVSDCSSRLMR